MRGVAALACVLAAAAASAAPPAAGGKSPARLFKQRCSACHDPQRVFHRSASRAEWREIVNRMRRMPQSGISKRDGEIIVAYLVSLGRGGAETPIRGAVGGREAFRGAEWLSILEIATVRDGKVRLGGRVYRAARDRLTVRLTRGRKTRVVALTEDGEIAETARIDRWRLGKVRYELHFVLYEIKGDRARIGRALKRIP